ACESHTQLTREIDGESARRGHRRQYGDPRHPRLLNQFKAGPPTDLQGHPSQRQAAFAYRPSDHLVDGVVATHVFAQTQQGARRREQASGAETAGASKDLLLRTERVGKSGEVFEGKNHGLGVDREPRQGAYGVVAGLAAEATGAGDIKVST